MEWLTALPMGDFLSALFAIVIIDLVLAGDNAIVIGLSARNLPKEQQKKVIIFGTIGAIVIRAILTIVAVKLLEIPGLMLIGGLLLIWIAYKLLAENKDHGDVKEAATLGAAIKTIIIADTVMGLDNVLAVAGASHGSYLLVILGLLISIPIVVWGSTLILKLIEKYPSIIYIGSAVLAWTATKMIRHEKFMETYFQSNVLLTWVFSIVVISGVVGLGYLKNKKSKNQEKEIPLK